MSGCCLWFLVFWLRFGIEFISVLNGETKMADQGAQLTEGFALQAFVEKAKSLSGAPLVELVQEVLSHPQIYVFQELLDLPNVQAVRQ
jgi:hypothetical protein